MEYQYGVACNGVVFVSFSREDAERRVDNDTTGKLKLVRRPVSSWEEVSDNGN